MNSNTSTPMVSIPSGVYDLESLKSECCLLGIPPSRPNIRRVRKALDIVDAPDAITNVANFADSGLYLVRSQTAHGGYARVGKPTHTARIRYRKQEIVVYLIAGQWVSYGDVASVGADV